MSSDYFVNDVWQPEDTTIGRRLFLEGVESTQNTENKLSLLLLTFDVYTSVIHKNAQQGHHNIGGTYDKPFLRLSVAGSFTNSYINRTRVGKWLDMWCHPLPEKERLCIIEKIFAIDRTNVGGPIFVMQLRYRVSAGSTVSADDAAKSISGIKLGIEGLEEVSLHNLEAAKRKSMCILCEEGFSVWWKKFCSWKKQETVTRLPCSHLYHKRCIENWLDTEAKQFCPSCWDPLPFVKMITADVPPYGTSLRFSIFCYVGAALPKWLATYYWETFFSWFFPTED